jgi:hypothetical protein
VTGFLTRIAARLSGSEGVLRPRTRSLFEPVTTAAFDAAVAGVPAEPQQPTSAFEHADEVEARTVANSPAKSSPAGRASSSQHQRNGTPVVTSNSAAVDHRAVTEAEAVGGDPVARGAARDPRGQAQSASTIEAEVARDAPASNGATTAVRPAGTVERTPGMRADQVGGAETIERIEARPVTVRRGTVQTSDATGTAEDDRRNITLAISQPASGVDGILQASVVARMASESLHPAQRAQNSEPTIHVTIGRVEVRAVAAPTSDRTRPERPSPVMSLDEYLRRGRGQP